MSGRPRAAAAAIGMVDADGDVLVVGASVKSLEDALDPPEPKAPPAPVKPEPAMEPAWDAFAEFWNGMLEGKGSIADVQEAFSTLLDRADEFKAAMQERAETATKPPAELLALVRRTPQGEAA